MNAKLLKCKECGKVYAVGDLDTRDGHRCECGITLDAWGNYFGKCEISEKPNRPWRKEDSKSDNKKLHEMTIRLNVEKTSSFNKMMEELRETNTWYGCGARLCKGRKDHAPMIDRKSPTWHGDDGIEVVKPLHKIPNSEKCPALVMVNESGEVKAIPIFSKDTELLVFRTVVPYREDDRKKMSKEYTEKIGIKCVVIDARTELVAVQNG